ncbi:Mpo1-like protein [Candidatus Uabimicrobium sp. HlEnr_7]|uniref:Mpo1-like protein n=1 Tax=Candidatus Uabimicrobium helgolandensis TaxID=3095367 RepID=UPI003556F8DA
MAEQKYETFGEFWPFYLLEHSDPKNRFLHFVGSLIALLFLAATIYYSNLYYLIGAFVSGYAFAWIGHFFVEHNRPATFKYPLKSFFADWVMFVCIITGQIGKQLEKAKSRLASE